MNPRIHFGKLEQVLAVVAGAGMVVGRVSQPEIAFRMIRACDLILLRLEIALRATVIRLRVGLAGKEGIGDCAAGCSFASQQTLLTRRTS